MVNIISVCGFNCSKCPAFKDNISGEQDRKKVDKGWKKYHRTKGWVYDDPYCQGCFANKTIEPLWRTCHIRKCAIQNEVKNCGYCADYPCNRLTYLINHMENLAEIAKEIGNKEDYNKFIEPYLGKERLDKIHKDAIFQNLIRESPPVIKAVDFPANLNFLSEIDLVEINQEDYEQGLKSLYEVLKNLLTLKSNTPGERDYERKRIKELTKILYCIGRDGKLIEKKNKANIEISLDSLKKNTRKGKFAIRSRLEKLKSHGIVFEFTEDNSKIKMSFSEEHKGLPISYVLTAYIQFLLENNGERKAYTLFSNADMSQYMK